MEAATTVDVVMPAMGDPVTTDHVSPAGSITQDSPPGR
jgi:aconitase A